MLFARFLVYEMLHLMSRTYTPAAYQFHLTAFDYSLHGTVEN